MLLVISIIYLNKYVRIQTHALHQPHQDTLLLHYCGARIPQGNIALGHQSMVRGASIVVNHSGTSILGRRT
jgi:hypothetical protein